MKCEPISAGFGLQVKDVQLDQPMGLDRQAELLQALEEYGLLLFEEQSLSAHEQVNIANIFGKVDPEHGGAIGHPENPQVAVLYCVAPPPVGGNTIWACAGAAFDGLSDGLKTYVGALSAIHALGYSPGFRRRFSRAEDAANMAALLSGHPPVEHPVVLSHPGTGRKLLFVNEAYTSHIVGIGRTESDELLRLLVRHIQRPEYQINFRWRKGSVAIWDNLRTQHYAVNNYAPHTRVMHRVAIQARGDCERSFSP
jgi:taurine dioxygenase